jgi:hypothetical protein
VPLRRQPSAVLNDQISGIWNTRSELLERLLADTWELRGSREHVEVHHIRRLADLRPKGRAEKPVWVKMMAARHRKSLAVCRDHHEAIHSGRGVSWDDPPRAR